MATTESDGKLRARLFKMARHYAPGDEPALKATVVMVAARFVGPDEEKIVRVTGYSGEYVAEVAERLRVSRLSIAEGLDYGDWSNSPQRSGSIRSRPRSRTRNRRPDKPEARREMGLRISDLREFEALTRTGLRRIEK